MTVTLDLTPELEARVVAQAIAQGLSDPLYISEPSWYTLDASIATYCL